MINKNIKKMLLFATLCILLIGIVSAESIDSDDSNTEADTITYPSSDTTEEALEVNDNIAYADNVADDNSNLQKKNLEEKTIKNASTNTEAKETYIIFNDIPDTYYNETVFINGRYYYGEDIPLTYTPLTVNFNNDVFTYTIKTDKNGYFYFRDNAEKVFKNNVTVAYHGNSNFKAASTTKTFNVKIKNPIDTNISLYHAYVDDNSQYVIMGDYYYGTRMPLTQTNMRVNIDGKTYTAKTDEEGRFIYKFRPKKGGLLNITVSYPGNSNFKKAEANMILENVKAYTYITLNDVKDAVFGENCTVSGHYYYGDDIPLTYTPMRIYINDRFKDYAKTDDKGYFSYTYVPETVDKTTVVVSYPGNSKFREATANKTFNIKIVRPINTHISLDYFDNADRNMGENVSISGIYSYETKRINRSNNQSLVFYALLTNTKMRIKINDQVYTTKTDENGYFTYKFKTNKTGTNNITVYYPGNSNFKGDSISKTFYVRGAGPSNTYFVMENMSDAKFDDYVGVGGYFYYDDNRPLTYTPVTLNINGNKHTIKTDDKGFFMEVFSIKHFGKNTITVSYNGNANFKAASATKTFNVYAERPIRTQINLTETDIRNVKVGDYVTISGNYTYGYGYGEPLTQTTMRIEVDGKTYTTKTDNNGYFTFKYKNTRTDTHYIVVRYPGNKNFQSAYNSISVNYQD